MKDEERDRKLEHFTKKKLKWPCFGVALVAWLGRREISESKWRVYSLFEPVYLREQFVDCISTRIGEIRKEENIRWLIRYITISFSKERKSRRIRRKKNIYTWMRNGMRELHFDR